MATISMRLSTILTDWPLYASTSMIQEILRKCSESELRIQTKRTSGKKKNLKR